MKILFVDGNASLQDKWIEPLRGEGWGVLRTRSVQDAEKIFEFHGDSLSALVVSEEFATWAENWNFPYVVLLTSWKDVQVMKHQNSSSFPAVAYLDFDSNLELLKQAVTESKGKAKRRALQPTGTDAAENSGITIDLSPASSPSDFNSSSSDKSEPGVVISLEASTAEKPKEKEPVEPTVLISISNGTQVNVNQDLLNFMNGDLNESQPKESVSLEAAAPELAELGIDLGIQLNPPEASAAVVEVAEKPEAKDQIEVLPLSVVEAEENDALIEEEPELIQDSLSMVSAPAGKDIETMKNYLALREQDVAVLTGQLRSSQERIQQLETQLKVEKAKSAELLNSVQKQDQQIKGFERDKQVEFEVLYQQVEDLNLQLRERIDKTRAIETKLKIMTDEVDKVKERVRLDIRKIRVREKELESQLEILKKDSTALLVARDEKIVELKRKIDLLEFNMELVQEQYGKERNLTDALRQKLKDAAGAVKRAGGLLDQEN